VLLKNRQINNCYKSVFQLTYRIQYNKKIQSSVKPRRQYSPITLRGNELANLRPELKNEIARRSIANADRDTDVVEIGVFDNVDERIFLMRCDITLCVARKPCVLLTCC